MAAYSEKLKDPRWQKKRLEILQRDNFTCSCCGDTKTTLHVHHFKYHGEPWEIDNSLLITFCEHCHFAHETYKDFIIRKIIKNSNRAPVFVLSIICDSAVIFSEIKNDVVLNHVAFTHLSLEDICDQINKICYGN